MRPGARHGPQIEEIFLPVFWNGEGVAPPAPEYDAEGRPFDRPRDFFVTVAWWLVVVIGIECVGWGGISIASRSNRHSPAGRQTHVEPFTDSAAGAEWSTVNAEPRDDASSPNGLSGDSAQSQTTAARNLNPDTGEAALAENPPDQVATDPTQQTSSSPFEDLRRNGRVLLLPAEKSDIPTQLAVIGSSDLDMQLFGGDHVLPNGQFRLVPEKSASGGRNWQVFFVEGSTGNSFPAGRFHWKNGRLSFVWLSDPIIGLKSCGLEMQGKLTAVEETEFCQLAVPIEIPSIRPTFAGSNFIVRFGQQTPITVSSNVWRLAHRLDGVPGVPFTGPAELKVGEKATYLFPDPDEPTDTLFEMDVSFKSDAGKPLASITLFTMRGGSEEKPETAIRTPLSKKDIGEIARRESDQTSRVERELTKIGEQIAREEKLQRRSEEKLNALQERSDKLEKRLERIERIKEWQTSVMKGLTELENHGNLELQVGYAYSTRFGERTIQLARTRGYAIGNAESAAP
jgi:hypothetical protein